MSKVIVYTSQVCPYCQKAKVLLKRKNIAFEEIDISQNSDQRAVMVQRAGGRTSVPQIFIGSHHVGGCDDLYESDRTGALDTLLAQDH